MLRRVGLVGRVRQVGKSFRAYQVYQPYPTYVPYFWANRLFTSAQLTTFHHALM